MKMFNSVRTCEGSTAALSGNRSEEEGLEFILKKTEYLEKELRMIY